MRRVGSLLVFAAGSLAGAVLLRRRVSRRRERIDLYYEDGSMVTHAQGSVDAERLLHLARDVLSTARS